MRQRLIMYSGGMQSFMVAYLLRNRPNVSLVFCDTKTEDPDLYRFIIETAGKLQLPLIWLQDGRDIWQVFTDVKYQGNNRIDPCSRVLKRETFKKWLYTNHPDPEKTYLYYGIGWNEAHRYDRLKKLWEPYPTFAPLIKRGIDKPEILAKLEELGIDPPDLYAEGFPHNNCGGFCVKTGQAQFRLLLEKRPARYLRHEAKQEELFKKIGPHGFIRMRINGAQNYLSLRQFRLFVESGGDVDKFDFGGCGCFVDDDADENATK